MVAHDHTISQLQMLAEAPAALKDPASAQPQQPSHVLTMTKHIPDAGKFNSNSCQLCSFLGQLHMKLIANYDQFTNEQSQIISLLGLLNQTMVLMVAPLLDTSVPPCVCNNNMNILLKALFRKFNCQGTT